MAANNEVDFVAEDAEDAESNVVGGQNSQQSQQNGTVELSEEQRLLLTQFQEIVANDNEEDSQRKLEKHNWNLEAAVQSTFNENEGLPSVYENNHPVVSPPTETRNSVPIHRRTTYTPGQSAVDIHRQNTWLNWLGNVAFFPLTVVRVGYSFTYHCITGLVLFILRIIWPNYGRVPTQPLDDILKFKEEFERLYGETHPTFYLGSYNQVLNDAKKELKFILVYLHCNDHQNTPSFCRSVLSNPGLREYINGNMFFWACDVNTNEGYKVSRAMRETTYPFLAIVCLRENRMTIVWHIEGSVQVDQLISMCAQVIDENELALVAVRAEREERNITTILRKEQDVAYMESLAKDKEKAETKQRQLDAAQKQEQLKRKKEKEKQRKIQEIILKRESCRQKLATLVEPSANDGGTIKIRIKLPNGEQLQRYFFKTDYLQLMYDFVLSHNAAPSEFLLSSNFPHKSYPIADNKTLEQLGITAPTAMFVQNLVDDSSDEE